MYIRFRCWKLEGLRCRCCFGSWSVGEVDAECQNSHLVMSAWFTLYQPGLQHVHVIGVENTTINSDLPLKRRLHHSSFSTSRPSELLDELRG